MSQVHAYIKSLPTGLPDGVCYVDHAKIHVKEGRDHCAEAIRSMVKAFLPALYPASQDSPPSTASASNETITKQPSADHTKAE